MVEVYLPEAGSGPWPGVVLFMDGFGVRPALVEVARRIAARGYAVAVPDLFHRARPYDPSEVWLVGMDAAKRERWRERFYLPALEPANHRADTAAALAALDRPEVAGTRIGLVGYCMGGGLALRAAAAHPDRVAAVAAFHPGNLVADGPDSPHRVVGGIRAEVYLGRADADGSFTDAHQVELTAAFAAGSAPVTIETWTGCKHGWTMEDLPVYDAAGAARHHEVLGALFARTLRAG
ncbi:MAG: alpha/beta fold hydrolase [Myxococcota bacterium]